MQLHLIFARTANGVIGQDNALPWHLPEDLAHFKRITLGCPVIMGRKTWDSLPPKFMPLPGRRNVVVSRQTHFDAPGAVHANSIQAALDLCASDAHVWIIGGAQMYAHALPLAHSAVVTEIEIECAGDAFAPAFGSHWKETHRERHTSAQGLAYSFVTLRNSSLK